MSIVADQIRRLDIQLDKIQLTGTSSAPSSSALVSSEVEGHHDTPHRRASSSRQTQLRAIVRALSTSSSSYPLLRANNLIYLLRHVQSLQNEPFHATETEQGDEDEDLEWLVVAKATLQTYGLILNALLEQILPLSDDIWYWDEVLGSYAYTGLYTLQTSPLRAWQQAMEVYEDIKEQFNSEPGSVTASARSSLGTQWREFYALVRKSIRDRSMLHAKAHVLSPFALCRTEARQKQAGLKRLREMNASGLGLLMDEGLSFDLDESLTSAKGSESPNREEWQIMIPKSIALMENVLRNVTALEIGSAEFEEFVFTAVEEDPDANHQNARPYPTALVGKLQRVLTEHLPVQVNSSDQLSKMYGRPPKLIRYWLPASVLLLSSSTLLRILANRHAEIIEWVQGAGQTVVDFWFNWVIGPIKNLIGTIRHDENSEVAIMSKRSLEADRDSLERMVVDFAIDNPAGGSKRSLSNAEFETIRANVKEGDLTPVLQAYERDLRRPFVGSVRGDLIRALLIQIQKTKVDVEVAIGGIDSLLKSQELVFGFVGLTPGILVSVAVFRWLSGIFGNRKGLRRNKNQREIVRTLRNIDRILNSSSPTHNGMLTYKEHGLLLCEVYVLRQKALAVLPGEIMRDFLEEIHDLVEIRTGVIRQQKVVERIRWAYSKWLH